MRAVNDPFTPAAFAFAISGIEIAVTEFAENVGSNFSMGARNYSAFGSSEMSQLSHFPETVALLRCGASPQSNPHLTIALGVDPSQLTSFSCTNKNPRSRSISASNARLKILDASPEGFFVV